MNKKAFTLVEFLISMLIAIVVLSSATVYFIINARAIAHFQDEMASTRDAVVVMHSMMRNLRFGSSITMLAIGSGSENSYGVYVIIKAGSGGFYSNDVANAYMYCLKPAGKMYLGIQNPADIHKISFSPVLPLSYNACYFSYPYIWNPPFITLETGFNVNGSSTYIHSKVRVIG